jgi:hypothetical protein
VSIEWIKMRKSLLTDPRVVRIASALGADRFRTIGALFSAWCLFDEQTSDGRLDGYTPEIFDEIIGIHGLAVAMESVGWLEINAESIIATAFGQHNGHTAKRRAQEAARKASARDADKKRTESAIEKKKKRKEEEEEIEEEEEEEEEEKTSAPASPAHRVRRRHEYSPEFNLFFRNWPAIRRRNKPDAYRAWQSAIDRASAQEIAQAADRYAKSDEGRSEYVRAPATWLRADGWTEEPAAWCRASGQTSAQQRQTNTQSVFDRVFRGGASDDTGRASAEGVVRNISG